MNDTIAPRLDVLVVGAGPTGMLLAAELCRHGLSVRIVDKGSGPTVWSKAQVIQARTLEILEHLGIVDRFLVRGHPLHTLSMYAPDCKRIFQVEIGDVDSAYPFMLSLPQRDTEELLAEYLGELGLHIERHVRIGNLIQSESLVTVQLLHGQEEAGAPAGSLRQETEELVRAAYVVGCDGISSTVRSLLGIEFTGSTYLRRIVQADVRIDWPLQHASDETVGFVSEHGPIGAFPLPGEQRYRLIAFDAGLAPTLENFQYLLSTRGPKGARVSDPAWMMEHTVHCRLAAKFRCGRVFLAGDAAHTHSPATGQGMNLGMQDSFNLAWKLALVQQGRGPLTLLDSYEAERMPVASQLLETTDAVTRSLDSLLSVHSSIGQTVRNHLLHFVTGMGFLQRKLSRNLMMLDIAYRSSPAVAGPRTATGDLQADAKDGELAGNLHEWVNDGEGPIPGERAYDGRLSSTDGHPPLRLHQLLHGTGPKLLLFAGAKASKQGFERLAVVIAGVHHRYGSLVQPLLVAVLPTGVPHRGTTGPSDAGISELIPQLPELLACPLLLDPGGALHRRYGALRDSVYLIRPDDHIGYRGQPAQADPLLRYLSKLFV